MNNDTYKIEINIMEFETSLTDVILKLNGVKEHMNAKGFDCIQCLPDRKYEGIENNSRWIFRGTKSKYE